MLQLSDMNPLHLARESSSDDSSSEEEAGEGTRMVEEDVNKVDFHFLKTGMEAKSGLSSSHYYVFFREEFKRRCADNTQCVLSSLRTTPPGTTRPGGTPAATRLAMAALLVPLCRGLRWSRKMV